MRILLSRIDSIGDVVLTLPMAGLIKQAYPQAQILFLGSNYTRHVVECSIFIDEFINWTSLKDETTAHKIDFFKAKEIDTFVHVFPNKELAQLAYKAGIKRRIGTSHRWYHHLYCNVRPNFTRKNSDLHEAQLNVKLLADLNIFPPRNYKKLSPFMGFRNTAPLDKKWFDLLSVDGYNVILHPKSKGSAREWGLHNFAQLRDILLQERCKLFLTGTEEEGRLFRSALLLPSSRVVDLSGQMDLQQLIAFIARADALVAASTGPLHIAAACGVKAVGIYPPVRPMHPGRWAPLGPQAYALSNGNTSCKQCAKKQPSCSCMADVSPDEVARYIVR